MAIYHSDGNYDGGNRTIADDSKKRSTKIREVRNCLPRLTPERFIQLGVDGFHEHGNGLFADTNETGNKEEKQAQIDFLFLDACLVQNST